MRLENQIQSEYAKEINIFQVNWIIIHRWIFYILILDSLLEWWNTWKLQRSEKSVFLTTLSHFFCRGSCFSFKQELWSKLYCCFLRGQFHSTSSTMMRTSLLNLLILWKSSRETSNSGGTKTFCGCGYDLSYEHCCNCVNFFFKFLFKKKNNLDDRLRGETRSCGTQP